MKDTVKTEERVLAPTNYELLQEALEFLTQLTVEQIKKIMEGLK